VLSLTECPSKNLTNNSRRVVEGKVIVNAEIPNRRNEKNQTGHDSLAAYIYY
jgi:hypothetical protein